MIWVFVFGGIALAGLIMLIAYAIWLAHKASDVFAELKVLGSRAERLLEITSRIEVPEPGVSRNDSVNLARRVAPAAGKRRRTT